MKPDWNKKLFTPKNEPITVGSKEASLKELCYLALTYHNPERPHPKGKEWARIARKVHREESVSLEEVVSINEAASNCNILSGVIELAIEEAFDPEGTD